MSAVGTVRVLPDVTGLDKAFDYSVPEPLRGLLTVGSIVRVPLHGRRVRGWVVAIDPHAEIAAERLQPVTHFSSLGPDPALVELAAWASVRWAAGRLRPFLVAASPPANVTSLPPPVHGTAEETRTTIAVAAANVLAGDRGVLMVPPAMSPLDAIVAAAVGGPTLVVMPTVARARAMAQALERRGLEIAVVPDQWARAAGGVDVVIGARVAAWAPCPGMRTAVVIDEHDETLQEERAPDMACARRRHRTCPPDRSRRAGDVTVPERRRCRRPRRNDRPATRRRPTRRVADRRHRRSQR